MASFARVDKIESKLAGLVTGNCAVCHDRPGRCSDCGRPVGATAGERGQAMAEFQPELGRARDAHRARLVEIADLLRVSQAGAPQALQERLDGYVGDMMPSTTRDLLRAS